MPECRDRYAVDTKMGAEIMTNKPMRQISSTDEAVRICPCGVQFSWSSEAPDELGKWVDDHYEHTNGNLLHQVGDDWDRVYGTRPRNYTTPLRMQAIPIPQESFGPGLASVVDLQRQLNDIYEQTGRTLRAALITRGDDDDG